MARVTFEKVTQDREIQAAMVGYLPQAEAARPAESVRYRPCPSCSRFMNRLNYGRISGVIVDVCKEDGVWFDQNELRRVVDFIQAGGLEKARDRQIRELEDAKRIQNQSVVIERATAPNDWTQMPATQGSVVTDLVFELFHLFTR
jgi:Zn-finger nucleic acid-binding protein